MTLNNMSRRDALRSAAAVTASAAVALLAAGCANESDPIATAEPGDTDVVTTTVDIPESDFEDHTGVSTLDISVVDNSFEPRRVTVSVGTKVLWTNNGRNHHNIVAEPKDRFPGIEHEQFPAGSVHAVTFAEAGDYPYFCSLHGTPRNGQNGVIRVVA